ncbi:MAG: YkgJ family cysteine cluster protein [Synergistaceae bacterium]|nr:YkgJ family cysteine cluster protein [Synergistaceae bacterium]
MNSPWWSTGLYFSCVRCGVCCGCAPGTVRFTKDELSAMADMLGVTEQQFTDQYTVNKRGAPSLVEKPNYDCVFLKKTESGAGCEIYPVRPSQCRTFPFWPDVLESPGSWEFYASSCPGMNSGELHDFDVITKITAKYK